MTTHTHTLKVWPTQFAGLRSGKKMHEVRVFDREYKVNDTLDLREYDFSSDTFTGESLTGYITWITAPGTFGLPENVGVLSVQVLPF